MNDLSDFDRKFGLDQFPAEFVREMGEGLRANAAGADRLAAYLAAPPEVQEAFDRQQKAAIERELVEQRELDEWWEAEFADDPLVQAVARRRRNDRRIVEAIEGFE